MKQKYPTLSYSYLCGLFGKTRQAYYKAQKRIRELEREKLKIISLVKEIRKERPKVGGRKLYIELSDKFKELNIKIGRDRFFDILREHNLLIKKKSSSHKGKYSHGQYVYPNKISGRTFTEANRLWVSDITYISLIKGQAYLFLITDGYSRKILGWYLSDNLRSEGALKALNMAVLNNEIKPGLIHHSDRGSQYSSIAYTNALKNLGIEISMSCPGSPQENAIAERVNGILKQEWLSEVELTDIEQAREYLTKIIKLYNTKRLHSSLNYLTPEKAHKQQGEIPRCWKNYNKQSDRRLECK